MSGKYPFTPVLGWSVSRYDKFTTCKRQYYFDYYAKFDNEVPQHKLAFLKHLTSIPLEVGNLVHNTIAALLNRLKRSSDPINTDKVLEYGRNLVDKAILSKTFQEIYYSQSEWLDADDLKHRVTLCLRNFFNSKWYEWLTNDTAVRRDQWVVEPEDYGEIRVKGLKAYCKVDFLFPMQDGTLCISDWKTGKADAKKHTRQMNGYVLYAQDIFGVTANQVKPVVAYLGGTYDELSINFSQGDLDEFAAQIARETDEMTQYCDTVRDNTPKPKDCFPQQTSNLCSYCNYRELCDI